MKLAVDIGGSYLRWEIPGKEYGTISGKGLNLEEYLQSLIRKYEVGKVAISFAGQVHNNRIISAPNIAAKFDPANLGVPYIIENDLKCAAIAQKRSLGCNNLALLYSGTGLGGAAIDSGKLICGAYNLAGEIGHTPYQKAPFRCGCGKDNCLELYASGSAIAKWANYFKVEASLKEPSIHALYTQALLYGAATLLTLFNPKILVLGGGVITNNPSLVEYIEAKLPSFAPSFALKGCRIELTRLQNASLEGAKILLERFE